MDVGIFNKINNMGQNIAQVIYYRQPQIDSLRKLVKYTGKSDDELFELVVLAASKNNQYSIIDIDLLPLDYILASSIFDHDNNQFIQNQDILANELKSRSISLANDIHEYMDRVAQTFGYDNLLSAVSYADESSVSKFQIEGIKFRSWRSLVWDFCYNYQNSWNVGSPFPGFSEIINHEDFPELGI